MKSFIGQKNKMCDEFANFVFSLTENRKKNEGEMRNRRQSIQCEIYLNVAQNSLHYSPSTVFIEADCLYRLLILYVGLFCLFDSFIEIFFCLADVYFFFVIVVVVVGDF